MSKIKDIRDYLHFYLGVELIHEVDGEPVNVANLIGITESECNPGRIVVITSANFDEWFVEEVKPILRRLSSMTEEEGNEIWFRYFGKRTAEDWSGDTGSAYFRPRQIQAGKAHAMRIVEGLDYSTDSFLTVIAIVPYLLSKGFDLFNLIDDKLAIDADTLKV